MMTAEATARAGFDYVCVDMQHGAIDYADAASMIPAIGFGGSRPIARAPWNEPGIIVPMVNTVAEAEAAVRACRYAPEGARSWGPTATQARTDRPYFEWVQDNVACIPMIETTQAIDNLDDILAVPGIDAVYVGPADLSITLGLGPGNHDESTLFTEALDTIAAACERAGVVSGIHATGALAADRLSRGFRMVTVGGDIQAMKSGLAAELDLARDERSSADGSMY